MTDVGAVGSVLFSCVKIYVGYGKDVEGRCLFGVNFIGLGNVLADQKKSGKRCLSVVVREQLGTRLNIYGSGTWWN